MAKKAKAPKQVEVFCPNCGNGNPLTFINERRGPCRYIEGKPGQAWQSIEEYRWYAACPKCGEAFASQDPAVSMAVLADRIRSGKL